MRKFAGIMFALLLVTAPALANAYMLTVKAGLGGTTTVTVGANTPKVMTGGTAYFYPTASQAVTVVASTGGTVTRTPVTSGALNVAGDTLTIAASATNVNTVATSAFPAAAAKFNVSLTQSAGGTLSMKLPNGTYSTTGVTGVTSGTILPLTIAAAANYSITSYTSTTTGTVSVNSAPGAVVSVPTFAPTAADSVTVIFAPAATITATVSVPTSGYTTQAIASTVSASAQGFATTYAWSIPNQPAGSVLNTTGTAASFSFTPAVAGSYTVQCVVSAAGSGASSVTKTAVVNVANYSDYLNNQCTSCHSGSTPTIVTNYAGSIHSQSSHSACSSCHTTDVAAHDSNINATTVNPSTFTVATSAGIAGMSKGTIFCTKCHVNSGPYAIAIPHVAGLTVSCNRCHTNETGVSGSSDAHSIQELSCVKCHSVAQANVSANLVNDNNGVRAITTEFGKWSHHVTGVTLNDAHCAACHLEGKATAYGISVNSLKHMVDNKIHLRNADTDADMEWDPAAPNHSTMDNFCMSCHDANGATSAQSALIQSYINNNGIAAAGKTASAKNPFGDTISNRYDKMQRPGVTNVDSQFDTANNSHHAVKGPRYTGRTRVAGARQIAAPATFANGSSAILKGARSTIYDAGNFNNLYDPLENAGGETAPRTGAADLGDDSTLHCGDCHTVGQWKVGSSTNAAGQPTPAAIGAHGSNNEYLLRNSLGTDERHTQNAFTKDAGNNVTYTNPNGAFLVCYNCHSYNRYGSIFVGTGLNIGLGRQPHAGEYDDAGRCNGIGNTIPFNGYTTGTATDGTQFASRFMGPVTKYSTAAAYAGEQNPDFGNVFGIQCLNCHNSGVGNAYGGIHGSANDTSWNDGTTEITPAALLAAAGVNANGKKGWYIDGMGNANKVERFLPGLGNAMHVPGTLGGFTGGSTNGLTYINGGVSNDTNWEQKHWQQTASTQFNLTTGAVTGTLTSAGAGCYTLGASQVTGAAIKTSDVTSGLEGPSVTGEGGPATEVTDTWGGCDDHTAGQAKGNHGFVKRIIRPLTY